jgi:coenzyme F420-reducing hydrogenase beta subunit
VRRWRELVADKKKWKDIVQQAKPQRGLMCKRKKKKKNKKKKKQKKRKKKKKKKKKKISSSRPESNPNYMTQFVLPSEPSDPRR